MHRAEKRVAAIVKKLKNSKIPDVDDAKVVKSFGKSRMWMVGVCAIAIFLFVLVNRSSQCFLEIPVDSTKMFRRPEDCSFCRGVKKIDKIKNVSSLDFDTLYIATGKPVVVTDGTAGWTALHTFSFDFFKNLYLFNDGSRSNCQFFPYKTEFTSLEEALNMSESRARLQEGDKPWYIGWSNCNDEAGKVLRKHYGKPYFLPPTSENLALSWIFMGGPGFGAHMHVDNVQYPSWQAQIVGRKRWVLAPPPECFYRCQEVDVIVEPTEIIVVDTNRWYHRTHILPGGISITIGSEFD